MNLNKLINPSEFQFAENWVSNVDEKKMHNLKVENYILFGGHSEDFKPRT